MILRAYKWTTEDFRCFWNNQKFIFGWNKTFDPYGFSLTTYNFHGKDNSYFYITGEEILPNQFSKCMEVVYYTEDIIMHKQENVLNVTKFRMLRKRPVAIGLCPVPGFRISQDTWNNFLRRDIKAFEKLIGCRVREEAIQIE